MQVQVADVAAKFAGCGQADQGVHVGAVHVDTPAMLVHQGAEFLDRGLEHAVGTGVGDHHRRQLLAVLFALGLQVGHVHVALFVAGGDHHRQASHLGTGRVGAVGAAGNQADVAVPLAVRRLPGADHQQAGVLALRAGVGLQADAGVTGGGAQPGAQLLVERGVAGALLGRRKGVDVGKFRPGDGDHFAGGIELHGAAAQGDHAAVQRQVLVAEPADVAQHAGFGLVCVEHRVRQKSAAAAQLVRNQRLEAFLKRGQLWQRLALCGKHRPELRHMVPGGGLIERHAQQVLGKKSQVKPCCAGLSSYGFSSITGAQRQRVEGVFMDGLVAQVLQATRQHGGEGGHPLRDAAQTRGAVVHRVHAGHHRRKHLCGADVGGGFFAPDVLFARLQRQPVGRMALGIHAHAHQPARHRALEFVAAGQVGGVRAAVAQRHAKALAAAHGDVGAQLGRWHQQGQRQQVGRHDHHAAARLVGGYPGAVVPQHAAHPRVLQQHAKAVFGQALRAAAGLDGDAQRPGPGLQHGQRLRQHLVIDQKGGGLGFAHAHGQRHGLGRGSRLVQHGGVGNRHAGQVGDHGLEIQQRL